MALLIGLATCASGQTHHGPRLGAGISTINAGQFFQWTGQAKFGLLAGYSLDNKLNDQISILWELLYASKGSLVRNAQIEQTVRTSLNYVEMPLMLKVSMNKDPQGLFLSAGGIFGYLVNGRQRTTQSGQELSNVEFDLSENNRRAQVLLAIGLGYELDHFEVELRGENSITPFDALLRQQNLTIGLHFTYRFHPKPEVDEDDESDAYYP
ncbi:MAG: PorT family protein [Flavobacteriales bacterium]|nr:PorT family protein [Flavobacteriales bacterium]